MNKILLAIVVAIVVIFVASSSLFIVDQRQVAVIKTFGEIKSVITEPGLNFNWPLVQTVSMLDKRIQTLDNPSPSAIFTAEKKSLVIDWLVKWRVTDPRQYIRNNGVEQKNLENRLGAVAQAAFNEEVTKHTVRGVLSDERAEIMSNVKKRLLAESKPFGVEIVDVRIKRVDFVPEVTSSVYKRMTSERAQVANGLRAEGEAIKEKIRADADKQVSVVIAEATLEAQKTKGEADAEATQVYGDAFGRDPKFAQFYRNLEAYRASFNKKSDVMVIDSSSDFFKAMRGAGAAGAGAPAKKK
ncbi:MAG: protease modulator HflC [Caulobacter sp.]|nr:protease modulator HflC [Vitreoscilla sp.]